MLDGEWSEGDPSSPFTIELGPPQGSHRFTNPKMGITPIRIFLNSPGHLGRPAGDIHERCITCNRLAEHTSGASGKRLLCEGTIMAQNSCNPTAHNFAVCVQGSPAFMQVAAVFKA